MIRRQPFLRVPVCALLVFLGAPLRPASAQTVAPDGFEDAAVAAVPAPTALAVTPDGRLLIASQFGQLYVYQSGVGIGAPALDLGNDVCAYRERGLVGLAVDPDFSSNHFIYASYTFNKFGDCAEEGPFTPVGRVSRFQLNDSNRIERSSERVLIDNVPSPIGVHNLDDVEFGKDGYLYVSVGDGGCDYAYDSGCFDSNDAARDLHALVGKVLRITRDGDIPPGNPFTGANTARCSGEGGTQPGLVCQEIFATGLRNPWRLVFDPNAEGTRFFIHDVGQDTWEEIDEGIAGADYGWNWREGFCANSSTTDCSTTPMPGLTNPLFAYDRSDGCASITGGAFVPNGSWPAEFDGVYLFSDFVCGTIFKLVRDGDGHLTRETFLTGLGDSSATDMHFGPHGDGIALYYTTYGGELRRLSYVGGANRNPVASVSAAPVFGAPPLAVEFDATASSDPDGDELTFDWDFGDGTPAARGRTVQHTYSSDGIYTATLRVSDPEGAESSVSVRIDVGNSPPQPAILAPQPDLQFAVGDTILLRGRADDSEDGELPESSLTWRVLLHHNTHTHGFLPPTNGNNVAILAPGPENLEAAATSYLEVQLTATDSKGRSTTVTQSLMPRTAWISVSSDPPGAVLRIDNAEVTTPVSVMSWVNYGVSVEAASQLDAGGVPLVFAAWSDGGAAAHTILTADTSSGYTAYFTRQTPPATGRTASASSSENIYYPPEAAIDGDPATRWSSEFSDPQWITIDLGAAMNIDRVVLQWESYATAYMIQVSDDAFGWTTVFETTSADGGVDEIAGIGARGRYVRMDGTARGTPWGYSLWEFQVFGDSESPEPNPSPALDDIVIWTEDMSVNGKWFRIEDEDSEAAGGVKLATANEGWSTLAEPIAAPNDYLEAVFTPQAGIPYRIWVSRLGGQTGVRPPPSP
jgi:glucose/arabinose dehydrogenase/PKD repeat protein